MLTSGRLNPACSSQSFAVSEQKQAIGSLERWLDLFSKTLENHCSEADAAAWEITARRMGFAMSSRLGFGEPVHLLP